MANISNINVNGTTHNIVDDEAMRLISSPIANNIIITDASGQGVDSGMSFADITSLPDGGTVGQVLTKQSSTDGDADWETVSIPTVDQTYDATSANAQSGVAVASALSTVDVSDKVSKSGTQTYDVSGTTFKVGSTTFTVVVV